MVAYNFKSQFAEAVSSGQKRCTIRADRRGKGRHARPGEAVQLYTGMRTRNCRKLVEPDPVCVDVKQVAIAYGLVMVNGLLLADHQVEQLVVMDGFTNAEEFFKFFRETHGFPFKGVIIQW